MNKKSPPPNLGDYQRHSTITRRDAVWLIASEIQLPDDDVVSVRNRVSHRLGAAIGDDQISYHDTRKMTFVFGRLVAWAQKIWPMKFLGWPVIRVATGVVTASLEGVVSQLVGESVLPDKASYQARIRELNREKEQVQREILTMRSELEALRRLKEADQQRRQKAHESGKKGGRPRSGGKAKRIPYPRFP